MLAWAKQKHYICIKYQEPHPQGADFFVSMYNQEMSLWIKNLQSRTKTRV